MEETLYVSIHIPKTAGTTLTAALRSQFGDRLQVAYEEAVSPVTVPDPQCIHGHDVMWMFADTISRYRQVRWLVFLRDPLRLAISLYFHAQRTPVASRFADRGLVHWLTHAEEYRWPDPPCYCHDQYLGQWTRDCGRTIDAFDFVGIVEQFDESMLLLAAQFGWASMVYEPLNVGAYPPPVLSAEVVERFMELNARDYAIYGAALARHERNKRTYGPTFMGDLERFRHRSTPGRSIRP